MNDLKAHSVGDDVGMTWALIKETGGNEPNDARALRHPWPSAGRGLGPRQAEGGRFGPLVVGLGAEGKKAWD
eukprot:15366888-Alexandrium_andersonii.AAC.1